MGEYLDQRDKNSSSDRTLNDRGKPKQQGTKLPNLQQTEGYQAQLRSISGSSNLLSRCLHAPEQPIQANQSENKTGIPDKMKTNAEHYYGVNMNHGKVHYNSSKPALLEAHAYSQGLDIFIAPGKEKYLPHEVCHLGQFLQGRVKATTKTIGGVNINDNPSLETEADVIGEKISQMGSTFAQVPKTEAPQVIQAKLAIGQPGNKYEQEADAMARQVVQIIHQPQSQIQPESLTEEKQLQLQTDTKANIIQRMPKNKNTKPVGQTPLETTETKEQTPLKTTETKEQTPLKTTETKEQTPLETTETKNVEQTPLETTETKEQTPLKTTETKKKKNKKNKKVGQTLPQTIAEAVIIIQQKVQELKPKSNMVYEYLKKKEKNLEANKHLYSSEVYKSERESLASNREAAFKNVQWLGQQEENCQELLPYIESQENSLIETEQEIKSTVNVSFLTKAKIANEKNDETLRKYKNMLEKQEKTINLKENEHSQLTREINKSKASFWELYPKTIHTLDHILKYVSLYEQHGFIESDQPSVPSDYNDLPEMSLLKIEAKKFMKTYEYIHSQLNQCNNELSNKLQHILQYKEGLANFFDEETKTQLSNVLIDIESMSSSYETWRDLYYDEFKQLTKFNNDQNSDEQRFQDFIDKNNSMARSIGHLSRKLKEIRQFKEEYNNQCELYSKMRIEGYNNYYKVYEEQIKGEIESWNNAYVNKQQYIVHAQKIFINGYNEICTTYQKIDTTLKEKIAPAFNSLDNQEEDFVDDKNSQEYTYSITRIENPLNETQENPSDETDSPNNKQPFIMAGTFKGGKAISGEDSQVTVPKVKYDHDGNLKHIGYEEVNNISFFRMANGAKLVRVEFDPRTNIEQREKLYENPFFKLKGTTYRFDLLNSGNRNFTWAIEADKDDLSTRIHPFDEAVAYTRQALLTKPLAALTGSVINGASVKDKTPFVLENNNDNIQLMVSDGWGFIKASVAKKLVAKIKPESESKSKQVSTSTPKLKQPALPNTQMLQWLPLDNKLIFELVENGIKELEQNQDFPEDVKSTYKEEMQKEKLYRAVTTGNFPVRVGTAIPVPGENVVLPPGILPSDAKVALHRSPADTMNWATGRVAASQNPLSEYIANMTALQYRWTGHEMGYQEPPFVFFKGMLGVIPDENWPSKYKTMKVDIVVCSQDRKIDEKWQNKADIDKSKEYEGGFRIKGDFNVSQLLDPGSLIGVPTEMMKNLSGDYDGDQVHMLAHSHSPALFQQIELQERNKILNPKLHKSQTFANSSGSTTRSLAPRIIDIALGNQLVGLWSTIADLLRTVHPLRLDYKLVPEIGELITEKEEPLENKKQLLQNPQDLWQYVGLAIKAGTDLAKTNLEHTEFLGRKLTAKDLMQEGKKIHNFLIINKGLKSPHKRRNQPSIVKDIRKGRRLSTVYSEKHSKFNVRDGHYGNLFEIMLAMDLHLEMKRSGENFTFKGNLTSEKMQQATQAIEKARILRTEITTQEEFILKLYEILGNLKSILQFNYKENKHARENGSIWMLLVIEKLQPAKLRQNLYAQSSPTPVEELQRMYEDKLVQIQELWNQFTYKAPTNEEDMDDLISPQSAYKVSAAAQQTLSSLGLESENITPNGDCLYNALISMGAFNGSVSRLRQDLADYVLQEYTLNETLQQTVQNSEQGLSEFTNNILSSGSFANEAGDITPTLLSMLLKIKIRVINEDGTITQASHGFGNTTYNLVRFNSPGNPAHFNATKTLAI